MISERDESLISSENILFLGSEDIAIGSFSPFGIEIDGDVLVGRVDYDSTDSYERRWQGLFSLCPQPNIVGTIEARQIQDNWLNLRVKIANNNDSSVHIGRIGVIELIGLDKTFLGREQSGFTFFREGWSMVSPVGTLRYNEPNFPMNPEYLPFAACDPERYLTNVTNSWMADQLGILRHNSDGLSLLIGALGCTKQFTCVQVQTSTNSTKVSVWCCADNIELAPREVLESEDILLAIGNGWELAKNYADMVAERMQARPFRKETKIWCSWNHFHDRINITDVENMAAYFDSHREEYPIEYMQIDDGFQKYLGDWFDTRDTFPGGLTDIVSTIRSRGFKAGLWVAPFWVDKDSHIAKEHPEWILRNNVGRPDFLQMFHDRYVATLDCTMPAVQQWLRNLFERLIEIGFEMFKLDFLVWSAAAGAIYADLTATRCEAYRRGMEAVRAGVGDAMLLMATGIPSASVGLVDIARVSCDQGRDWYNHFSQNYRESSSFANMCRNTVNRGYFNHKWFLNDSDAVMIRIGKDKRGNENNLTDDEIQLAFATQLLSGGAIMLGGDPRLSSEKRLRWLVRLFENRSLSAEPIDMFTSETPEIWWQAWSCDAESLGLLGLFNFSDGDKTMSVSLEMLKTIEHVKAIDFWTETEEYESRDKMLSIGITPHSCKLLVLKKSIGMTECLPDMEQF